MPFRLHRVAASAALFFCAALFAQTGTVPFVGARVTDASGVPLARGTAYFTPTTSTGAPMSFQLGGGGQVLSKAVSCQIIAGQVVAGCRLADTSATNPVNPCLSMTIVDNATGKNVLGPGYSCMQPKLIGSYWCPNGICDFNLYIPAGLPGVAVTAGPQGQQGPPGCVVGSTCTADLNPQSVGGVVYPDQFDGADVGARINTAVAAKCNTSVPCYLKLMAHTFYDLTTSVSFPDNIKIYLNMAESVIASHVPGAAFHVGFHNEDSQTGGISNGQIIKAADNNSSTARAIVQESRIWFTYRDLRFAGFHGASDIALLVQNTGTAQWDGSGVVNGYNERNHFENISITDDTVGIQYAGSQGGTNSFARLSVDVYCDMFPGQKCMVLSGAGSDVYGASFKLVGNLSSTPTNPSALLRIQDGAEIRGSAGLIECEGGSNAGHSIELDSSGARFVNNFIPTFNTGNCPRYDPTDNSAHFAGNVQTTGDFTWEAPEFTHGNVGQAINTKMHFDGASMLLGIPNYGLPPVGEFAIWGGDPYPATDIFKIGTRKYVVRCGPGTLGRSDGAYGCTFGDDVHAGPKRLASAQSDSYALVNNSVGVDGTQAIYSVDTDGTIREDIHAVRLAGQPTAPRLWSFYDAGSLVRKDAMSLDIAYGVSRLQTMGTVQVGTTPATCTGMSKTGSTAGAGEIRYVPGSSGVAAALQACRQDATGAWGWVNLNAN